MTILITGCAGFIGSAVAQALLDRGERVVGVDIDQAGGRLHRINAYRHFLFYSEDVSLPEVVNDLVDVHNVDRIIHLAAKPGVRCAEGDAMDYGKNVLGQIAVLEACRKHGARLVYASSSSIYGHQIMHREMHENDKRVPGSIYAVTKASAEMLAETYARVNGVRSMGLRFFSVYGPHGREDMAPMIFARAIMSAQPITIYGSQRRDFTYIDDVVAAVLAALDKPEDGHEVYNVGAGDPRPISELVTALCGALGAEVPVEWKGCRAEDVNSTWANNFKMRNLGWQPEVKFEDGVARFAEWFQGAYA